MTRQAPTQSEPTMEHSEVMDLIRAYGSASVAVGIAIGGPADDFKAAAARKDDIYIRLCRAILTGVTLWPRA